MKKINFLDHTDSKKLHEMQHWYRYTVGLFVLGGSVITLLHMRQLYRWWGVKKEYARAVSNKLKNDTITSPMKNLVETKNRYEKQVLATREWAFSCTNPALLLSAIASLARPEYLHLFHLQNTRCSFELVLAHKEDVHRIMEKLKEVSCLKKIKLVSLSRQNNSYRVRINGLTATNR